jgi:hypothetical protein
MVVFRKNAAIMNNTLKVVMIAAMAMIWAAGTAQAGYKFSNRSRGSSKFINYFTSL